MNTTLNQNHSFNTFIVAGIVTALVLVAAFAIATSTTETKSAVPNVSQTIEKSDIALAPLSADAFPQYHQSEWHSSAVTNVTGLEMYQQSERTSIPAQSGLIAYQLSERTLVNPLAEYQASERTLSPIASPDFSLYHLSERTMTQAIAISNLSQYFVSERTLVDPLAGLATYFESERTSIPATFTQYQFSEWFGK